MVQDNVLTAAEWVSHELSNVHATVNQYRQSLTLNLQKKSELAFQFGSFLKKIKNASLVKHVTNAVTNEDTSELTLFQKFIRIGCWASMPIFLLKILILSLTSISLILLSAFPAEVLSALIVMPYLVSLVHPDARYNIARFFAQKYKMFCQMLMKQQLELEELEEEEEEEELSANHRPD